VYYACTALTHATLHGGTQVLKFVKLLPVVGPMFHASSFTLFSPRVFAFLVFFLYITFVFTIGCMAAFGSDMEVHRSFFPSFLSVFSQQLGISLLDEMQSQRYVLGGVMWVMITILGTLVLVNLFIAVISSVYEDEHKKAVADWQRDLDRRMAEAARCRWEVKVARFAVGAASAARRGIGRRAVAAVRAACRRVLWHCHSHRWRQQQQLQTKQPASEVEMVTRVGGRTDGRADSSARQHTQLVEEEHLQPAGGALIAAPDVEQQQKGRLLLPHTIRVYDGHCDSDSAAESRGLFVFDHSAVGAKQCQQQRRPMLGRMRSQKQRPSARMSTAKALTAAETAIVLSAQAQAEPAGFRVDQQVSLQMEAVESSMGKQSEQLNKQLDGLESRVAKQIRSAEGKQSEKLAVQIRSVESSVDKLEGKQSEQLEGLESRVASRVEMQIKSVESRMESRMSEQSEQLESRMSEQSEQLNAVSAQLRQVLDLLAQGTPQPPPLRQ
jgi:hypothetical protein